MKEQIFTAETVQEKIKEIKAGLNFPYIGIYASELGGKENVSIMLSISLDSPETWANQIFENSRFGSFDISNNGAVENFTACGFSKVRKFTGKSISDIINKLNKIKGE